MEARNNISEGGKFMQTMQKEYARTVLPNGLEISYLRSSGGDWEVPSMYKHIQEYFKCGIRIPDGGVVFDVGANIGLFSLFVNRQAPRTKVYAFEPVPAIFSVLKENLERYDYQRLSAFPFGLAAQNGEQSFTYYPNAPGLSTHHHEQMDEGLEKMIQTIEKSPQALPDLFQNANAGAALGDGRFQKMRAILGLKSLFQSEIIHAAVFTLSHVVATHRIERIDLLKVDVNGSEIDVFNGIKAADWRRIKQVVVEVPDSEGKIDEVTAILRKNQFSLIQVAHQAIILDGLSYSIIYALA
jgi:FkbM family methyltransferase